MTRWPPGVDASSRPGIRAAIRENPRRGVYSHRRRPIIAAYCLSFRRVPGARSRRIHLDKEAETMYWLFLLIGLFAYGFGTGATFAF